MTNSTRLIGVLGVKESGKDTVADYLVTNYLCKKIAFAQPLKEATKILFGFTDVQLNKEKEIIDDYWNIAPRQILQYLGTDVFRNDIQKIIPHIKDNFWVETAIRRYKEMVDSGASFVVISDVRFQNEINQIHENGGIIIKLIRPSLNCQDTHASEKCNELEGDYTIVNGGTLDNLYQKVDQIMSSLFIEKKID